MKQPVYIAFSGTVTTELRTGSDQEGTNAGLV